MIKSALEVIVTQIEDILLAFFIARLIEENTNGISNQFLNFGLETALKDYYQD